MEEGESEENYWILDLPLTKQGNSLAVNIPKKVVNALNLQLGDKVRVILRRVRDDKVF